jgi:hypothetical protein
MKHFKKIDVYKDGNYLASIGDIRYSDYPTYIQTKGKSYANKKRELYLNRHKNDEGIAGKLARILLW